MKVRKSSLAVFLTLALVAAVPAGLSAETVNLRFVWWGGDARHKATLEAIDAYQALNPNVKIQAEYGGADGYQQKMKLQLAAKTAPDVMQLDQTWLDEITNKTDFFVDLSTRKDFNLAAFDKGFLADFCTFNGKVVGAPTGLNAQVLLVNKTAALKMGVNIDNLSTWDGLLEEGKKLHAKDPAYYLLSHDTANFMGEVLVGYIKQLTGKSPIDRDYNMTYSKADLTKAFTWLQTAVQTGVIQPPGEAALYALKGDQNPKWINQQILCAVDWASNYARYMNKDSEYALLLPPTLKSGAKSGASTMRPSQELCVNNRSANVAEAVKFTNWFLNDPAAARILGDVRSVPASTVSRAAAVEAGKVNPLTANALTAATASRKVPDAPIGLNTQLIEIQNDVAMKVEFLTLTPDKAADEMIKRMTTKLASLKASATR